MLRKIKLFQRRMMRLQRRHVKTVKTVSRHPFAVPVFVVIGMALIVSGGYMLLRQRLTDTYSIGPKVVIINHDHVQQIVPSIEPTVGKLLQKLHISLAQGDVVEPSLSTPINQDDFRINIYRAVPVEIVDGTTKTFTFSAASTPRAIVAQAGIKLYPADYVNTVPVHNFIQQNAIGEQVVIDRATPINMNLYGTPLQIRTHAKTVADLIKQQHINLVKNDQVLPAPDTPITSGMEVFIVRKGIKIESVTTALAMPVQTVYDNSLSYGTNAIRQQGSAGQEVITYQLNLQNGIAVSRSVLQTIVTVPPVTEIIAEGTNLAGIKGDMALAGIAPSDYYYADYIISHESGWCPTKWQGEYGYCPATYAQIHNPGGSYGYGLCQSTPADKMAAFDNPSTNSYWWNDPIVQLEWCNSYADTRYGGWANAWSHWTYYGNW